MVFFQTSEMGWSKYYKDVLPFIVLVATECAGVGLNTLFKAASLQGLSYYVFTVYIYVINTLILLPIPFIFSSKTKRPAKIFPLFWRLCLLGCLSLSAHIIGFKGIQYSSPALASAMSNLTSAFTFGFAIIFRMEKLVLRSASFQAKLLGTVISIAGALVVVLYKGPAILSIPTLPSSPNHGLGLDTSDPNWVFGGLLLIAQSVIFSLWYIVLTNTMKLYPSELVISFFHCLCVAVLSIPVGLIAEPNMSVWIPKTTTALMAFIYSGLFGPAFIILVHSWSLHLKGPVYVAIFKPSSIVIAAVVGFVFLGDALYLGSVIGAVVLSVGVYAVIWGKAEEEKTGKGEINGCNSFEASSSTEKIPLLQNEDQV